MRAVLFVLSGFLVPASLMAQGWIMPRPCVRPVGIEGDAIRNCPPIDATVVRTRSDVRAELVGEGASRVLRYEVEERFVNNGGRVGEADYIFPLPKGAAFQDLKLSINGEMVAGETMNAGEARRIYEEIVRRQRDPALVEWMGHGLLRARIFPINPGEEKRVVVRFQSVAEREGDALRVEYARGTGRQPTGVEQRRPASNNVRASFTLSYPQSNTLGTPYSPTHSLDISDDGGRRRVEVRGDASDLTLLVPVRAGSAPSISVLAHAPSGEDGFALIALSPPANAARDTERMARDVTFVLDVSGSMSGRKMDQARAAGRQLLRTLGPRDRFRLIDFSTDVRTFRDEFVSATPSNISAAERYLEALEPNGSTNISGAVTEALRGASEGMRGREEDRLSVVLFVTDGEPTVGERQPAAIAAIAARERGRARLFTFGVGTDVNVALLEQMALDGRGTAQFVRPDESVERAVGLVASRLVDPVLTDVRVRVEGSSGDVRLSRMLPAQPVDLFAGQDLVLLARYTGDGRARVIFEGRRRGETVRWASDAQFPERERENPFVARLWATQRVGYLSAEKRKNGGNSELDSEIRQLGERFGIPTEFTSYLVLEPGMVAQRRDARALNAPGTMSGSGAAGGVAAGRAVAPAAAPMRDQQFEAAKQAAEQRAATSLATESNASASADVRRVGARTFVRRDGGWVDTRYTGEASGVRLVRIKAFSKAYFDLMEQLPELRAVFAIDDQVIVSGKSVAIAVGADGASELDAGEMRRVVQAW